MARKHQKPEKIVTKLWQVETLAGQSKPVAEAIQATSVTEPTYIAWNALRAMPDRIRSIATRAWIKTVNA